MSTQTQTHQKRVEAAIDAVKGRSLPPLVNALSLAGIAWGVIALGYGLTMGDRAWTFGAMIVGIVYGLAIAQGGIMFSVIQSGTQSRWGRGLKRVAESFGLFLPVVFIFLAVFLVIGLGVYPWNPDTINGEAVSLTPHMQGAPHSKALLLSKPAFVGRLLGAVGLMLVLDFIYLRASLGPDLLLASKRLGGQTPGWWKWFIGSSTDVQAAQVRGAWTQEALAPVLGITYALVMSFVAFDLIMSLDPWWASNMFGAWTFMSSLWMSLAFLAVFTMVGWDWLNLRGWVTTRTTHDLGRFMLAGCMFWAYTLFSQILPIWYANMPEETGFLLVRLMLPQWSPLARVVAVLCFLAPFTILLSRGVKKMRWPFAGVSTVILVGLFLERSLLVMPSVWLGPSVPWGMFLFVNVGVLAGVLGGLIAVVGRALASMPTIPVSDPLLEEHPWDEHVHSLDARAHH